MSIEGLKVEAELEECCVCGSSSLELSSPEEHDAMAPPGQPPLRTMLLQLNNNKVVPNGRLCPSCIRRALEAYSFSTTLASRGPPPLSEKIRALRKRLHELTQKIDVFIVVGGGGGADGAYSEEDIIMVERGALAAGARADATLAQRVPDARGHCVYQCTVCPLSFTRMCEFRSHTVTHPPESVHTCWTCGAQLASAAELTQHALLHAPNTQLHCHLCNTTFQSSLEQRRHEPSCPSTCPSCDTAFPSRSALRAHASSHEGLCPECFLQCGGREERDAHVLHHRRDKHFVCGYKACILRFHTRSNLLAHIRKCHGAGAEPVTGGEEPVAAPVKAAQAHACAHCVKTFGSASALKRHARVHQTKDNDAQDMDWTEEGEKVEYLEVETLEDLEQQVET